MSTENEAPHSGSPSAWFIGANGPVYALVGTVLDRTKVSESDPVHVLIAPEAIREYTADLLPVFDFFQTPREERQALEWISWAGGDKNFLGTLVATGATVRVDTRNPLTAAKSLKGLRIIPQCAPDIMSATESGRFDVKRSEDATKALSIRAELGEAIWGEREPADLPTVIKDMARKFKIPRDQMARRVLSSIPAMLRHGYARLEWLRVPRD